MADIITAEFIPWKTNQKHTIKKCRRHGRYRNRGIHSVENKAKTCDHHNAVGMADMVAAEFIPWKAEIKYAILTIT